MAYELGDIFIGDYPETQAFGARPAIYAAKFNLRGHNGLDFGCPSMTPVLAAAPGWVSEIGFDAGGYGNYIKIVHDGFLTLYGHLNDIQVKKGDRVVGQQLIGHSNNSGFSDAPHLHFGVAPCDGNGIKTDPQNGFSGYIDPNGPLCHWSLRNTQAPATAPTNEVHPDIPVKYEEFGPMVAQGTNYKVVAQFALNNGLNEFLSGQGQEQVDLSNNPGDDSGGAKINSWISALINANQAWAKKSQETSLSGPIQAYAQAQAQMNTLPDSTKVGLFSSISDVLKSLFFTKQ